MKEVRKIEKAEDFIGWVSPDGKLRVVSIVKKSKHTTFKLVCTECSKDPELFPDGYFVSVKSSMIRGIKPCGCGRNVRWKDWQYLILARRAAKDRFLVHGFAEEFHGQDTKLNLECLKDGYKWATSINNIMNGKGCPKCAGNIKPTEQEALQKCIDICKEMDYDVVGFVDGYKGAHKTRFEYNCKIHGKQNVCYNDFVNIGSRCSGCAVTGYSTSKQGTFYVYQWTKDSHSFIKFGITNQKELTRIKEQKRETKYNYKKVWSATFEDGSIPLYIENCIKNSGIEIGIMSKEEFPDGFTETTNISNLVVLDNLITDSLVCLNTYP